MLKSIFRVTVWKYDEDECRDMKTMTMETDIEDEAKEFIHALDQMNYNYSRIFFNKHEEKVEKFVTRIQTLRR